MTDFDRSTASSRTEATWLRTVRLDALAWIGENGYPTKRDEAWRYAPHDSLRALSFGGPVDLVWELPPDALDEAPQLDGPTIVVVNGRVDEERSNLGDIAGLTVTTIGRALRDHPELVAAHFEPWPDITDAYNALNATYALDGAIVLVEPGLQIEQPVHVIDIEAPDETNQASCSGVVIDVGERSALRVVETRIGFGNELGGSNIRTTAMLEMGARLDHVLIQDVPSEQLHLSRLDVRQRADSELRSRSFNLGASYSRIETNIRMLGTGARADLAGLNFGVDAQIHEQHVTVRHEAPACTSEQAYRSVLDDRSRSVFNGAIIVAPGADGTDAAQSNDNLLLTHRAEANSQPRLEILADDVACSHGATVGELDEDAIHYLRSRGLGRDEARAILTRAFADQTIDRVADDRVRAWVLERLGHGADDVGTPT